MLLIISTLPLEPVTGYGSEVVLSFSIPTRNLKPLQDFDFDSSSEGTRASGSSLPAGDHAFIAHWRRNGASLRSSRA